jgi:hypothetical protein
MGYVSILAAFLVVAGLLVVPQLYAEDAGRWEYSKPSALENGTAILAGEDGGEFGKPPMLKTKTVIVADDGGGTDSIGILDCLRSPWICI